MADRSEYAHQNTVAWGPNVNAHPGYRIFVAGEDGRALRALLADSPDNPIAVDLLAKLDAATSTLGIDLMTDHPHQAASAE